MKNYKRLKKEKEINLNKIKDLKLAQLEHV